MLTNFSGIHDDLIRDELSTWLNIPSLVALASVSRKYKKLLVQLVLAAKENDINQLTANYDKYISVSISQIKNYLTNTNKIQWRHSPYINQPDNHFANYNTGNRRAVGFLEALRYGDNVATKILIIYALLNLENGSRLRNQVRKVLPLIFSDYSKLYLINLYKINEPYLEILKKNVLDVFNSRSLETDFYYVFEDDCLDKFASDNVKLINTKINEVIDKYNKANPKRVTQFSIH